MDFDDDEKTEYVWVPLSNEATGKVYRLAKYNDDGKLVLQDDKSVIDPPKPLKVCVYILPH